MTETVVVVVGNSDDKLTQKEWFLLCKDIGMLLTAVGVLIHFAGGPDTRAQRQNYCWIFDATPAQVAHIRTTLPTYAKGCRQNAVAWLQGVPEFLEPE